MCSEGSGGAGAWMGPLRRSGDPRHVAVAAAQKKMTQDKKAEGKGKRDKESTLGPTNTGGIVRG